MLVVFAASSAWAALTTMTFDEAFVTGGTIGDRQDGTKVSTQYAISPYGVTWADIYPGADFPSYTGQVVCLPGEFNGTGLDTDNYLLIYGIIRGAEGAPRQQQPRCPHLQIISLSNIAALKLEGLSILTCIWA